MNADRNDVDRAFDALRGETWSGGAHRDALGARLAAARSGRGAGHGKFRTAAMAGGMLALAVGAAAAVKVYRAYVMEAHITVQDGEVDLIVNGQKVDPDQVERLPDGTVLVTVNGAKVLIDPNQPGGASATIRVESDGEPAAE